MKNHSTRIPVILLIAIGIHGAAGKAEAQAPDFPFKFNPDGSVDPKELLELTKRPAVRDRITDAELEAIKAEHEIDYGPGFRPTEKPEMPVRGNLYADSALLSDGQNHTLIPKDALIWVPDALRDRVVEKPVGRLILWPEFVRQHSWVRAEELSLETSEGKTPLTEDQWKKLRQPHFIVVSVHLGNPISLILPDVPKEAGLAAVTGESDLAADPGGKPDVAEKPSDSAPAADPESETPRTGGLRPDRFDVSNRFRPPSAP